MTLIWSLEKNSCSVGNMSAASSRRVGAPGRSDMAPLGVMTAASSTKTESG